MNEIDNTPVEEKKTTTVAVKKKSRNRLGKYILKHKVTFSLLFALTVVFIWAQFAICKLNKENRALIVTYEARMDSLNTENYKSISKVFSWVVRSDIMRNNLDQANLHLSYIIKEPYVKKAFIVDTDKKIILLSTNENENGLPISDITLLQSVNSVTQINDTTIRFMSPVTGLGTFIGISVIETNFKY